MDKNNFEKQNSEKNIEEKIEQIYMILRNIQMNQQDEKIIIQKNHAATMKRINKLQEYNQIADMTNQIFEIRIAGIEEAVKKLNKTLAIKENT